MPACCQQHQHKQAPLLATKAMDFQRASSFCDLLAANLRFLRGELRRSPYHHGPPAPETGPLLAQLERLHTHRRFFTFESQPGMQEQTSWNHPCATLGATPGQCAASSVWHAATEQRAYVDLWCEAGTLSTLLSRLQGLHSDHLFFFVDSPGRPDLFQHNVPPAAAWHDDHGRPHLNLTRERGAPARAALADATWALHTNAVLAPGWADAELATLSEGNPQLGAVLSDCALVGVMARQYGAGHPTPLEALLG